MLHGRARATLFVSMAGAFAIIASSLPERGGTDADFLVSEWVDGRYTDTGSIIATWISWLGDTAMSGLLAAAVVMLLYRRRPGAAATVVVATLGAMLLDTVLKPIFHRERPETAIEILAGPTYSFPSGHAMASIVGYGVLAWFRLDYEQRPWKRRVILIVSGLMIAAVGCSRLYLGVHYLSDVAGGFLAGALWLMVCMEVYHRVTRRVRRSPPVPGARLPR
jgi:undecaprenyl-diphosphatase